MTIIKEYENALQRLIDNKPINISNNFTINNDTVALEAGRKRGSIKKSRDIFTDLIKKIDEASNIRKFPKKEYEAKILKLKTKSKEYQKLYEDTLNRELMLIEKVSILEKELKRNVTNKLIVANNV